MTTGRNLPIEEWNLGVIGNWSSFDTDLNGDGQYQGANDRIVAGSFNDANEVSQLIQTLQGSQTTLGFTYDKAGNLREQALSSNTSLRFTHDAWNRLVKVVHVSSGQGETIRPRGEYEYNGLFQRVVKRSDKDITDGSNDLDEQRLLYYSGAWQIVEERIDDNWSSGHATDRIVQHVWGLRYIDDLVLNRQDSNADGSYTNQGDFTHYALTDHQFSVIALIDSAGNLIERVSYTPYGEARHHWRQDVDGDGDIDATDQSIVSNVQGKRIYESGYNVDADFDRDGLIDSNDSRQIGSGAFKAALPAGWISSLTTGNTIGFSGYVFNREIDAGGLYTVRFRHYDPVWGRWTSRDPLGYETGMSLYEFMIGSPAMFFDPFGTDIWIEGASGDEPNGHQAICVGDPNGEYRCFSFGHNGEWDWGLVGEVYEDTDKGGEIVKDKYLKTSKYGDQFALAYLELLLGRKGAYRLLNANCRTFSARQFEILMEYLTERYHAVPVTPRPRKAKPNSGGNGPSSPSTGTSSESTTTTSDPTAAGSNSTTDATCTSS